MKWWKSSFAFWPVGGGGSAKWVRVHGGHGGRRDARKSRSYRSILSFSRQSSMPTSGSTVSSTVRSPSSPMVLSGDSLVFFFWADVGWAPTRSTPRFLFSRSPESLRTLIKRPPREGGGARSIARCAWTTVARHALPAATFGVCGDVPKK